MEKSKELLMQVENEVELQKITGGWNPGPATIWGGIMDWATGGCSWGGFYGNSKVPGGNAGCTRR